ncbi:hypothetical protein XA68_13112 [Ophiocordyceps unilateralis]|uniref:Uncharacterized protein n=1 Tax=Ophiocordyceps unilateralis TaxID=268505 RepID=A0A2A9PCD1_OPHUN|nr:hypothetical protein XA68_13112 [Ophiocordyceps unilateralis]
MAPLILHNVPDEECYVGEDGIKRPYAIYFNQHDGHGGGSTRSRRTMTETGSFGKSTRRSRSRTGTPGGVRARENPTLAAADKLFGEWVSNQAATAAAAAQAAAAQQAATTTTTTTTQEETLSQRRAGDKTCSSTAASAPSMTTTATSTSTTTTTTTTTTPVEMILRGYRSVAQQYAAIAHYEALAGSILEDYPRDPPATQRRWQSALRDPALTQRLRPRRTGALAAEERALVNRADGGAHWVKVTFDSAESAAAAAVASPQPVLGHLVYAEPYRGLPPARDEPCPDVDDSQRRVLSTPGFVSTSRASSQTVDTATMTPSSATMTEPPPPALSPPHAHAHRHQHQASHRRGHDDPFCTRIPSVRRVRLLPAEEALLPQPSALQRFAGAVPFVRWFSGSMIGNEVPRTDAGDFDWGRASLYWKCIWWLDNTFGLFGGDVCCVDKED